MAISNWVSGLFEYSVLSTDWWESALQGSVGSFVALAGVVALIKHELGKEERANKAEANREVVKRGYESLTEFRSDTHPLISSQETVEEPAIALADALLKFSVRESPGRTDLNEWIGINLQYITQSRDNRREDRIIGLAATFILGALTTWVTNGLPDDYFLPLETLHSDWKRIAEKSGIEFQEIASTPNS